MKNIKSVISFLLCAALLLCALGASAAGSTVYSNEFNLRNRIKLTTPTPAPTETLAPAEPEATIDGEATATPETTPDAAETTDPTETPEATVDPLLTEEPLVYEPQIDVEMISAQKEIYWYGDIIDLRAIVLDGDPNFDYAPYITWQRSLDGQSWETVNGTGYQFSFVMGEETSGYSWRAALELPDTVDAATAE